MNEPDSRALAYPVWARAGLLVIFVGIAVWLIALVVAKQFGHPFVALVLVVAAVFLYVGLRAARIGVVLTDDVLISRGFLVTRTLARDQIVDASADPVAWKNRQGFESHMMLTSLMALAADGSTATYDARRREAGLAVIRRWLAESPKPSEGAR